MQSITIKPSELFKQISQKLSTGHDMLIAKLQSYGLSLASKWLFIKPQINKSWNVFSKWQNIETGVP